MLFRQRYIRSNYLLTKVHNLFHENKDRQGGGWDCLMFTVWIVECIRHRIDLQSHSSFVTDQVVGHDQLIALGHFRTIPSSGRQEIVDCSLNHPPVTWQHLLVGVFCVHRPRWHVGSTTTFTEKAGETDSCRDEYGCVFWVGMYVIEEQPKP